MFDTTDSVTNSMDYFIVLSVVCVDVQKLFPLFHVESEIIMIMIMTMITIIINRQAYAYGLNFPSRSACFVD